MEESRRKLCVGLIVFALAVVVVGVICVWTRGTDTKIDNNGTLVLLEGPSIWH